MCDIYKLTNKINSLIYETVRKNSNRKLITLNMDYFTDNIRNNLNCSVDPELVNKLVDIYNTVNKQTQIIIYQKKQLTKEDEKIIQELIIKYGLSSIPLNKYFIIQEELKTYYPYHGKKVDRNICPENYALDIESNVCLSIDLLPFGTHFKFYDKIIAGSGRSLLLYIKNKEGSWDKVIKFFESKNDDVVLTDVKSVKTNSYPVLSQVFNFENITYFTKNWPDGLFYIPDFMNYNLQQNLFNKINNLKWNQPEVIALSKKLERDVIQYGYIYDFNIKDVKGHPLVKANNPPKFIKCLVDLILNSFPKETKEIKEPNQILITKLKPGQGLGPLKDHPMFDPISITLSLGSKIMFIMKDKNNKIDFPLLPGSLLILDRNSKTYLQEIPATKTDTYTMNFLKPKIISWDREERISITIRHLKKEYQGEDRTL